MIGESDFLEIVQRMEVGCVFEDHFLGILLVIVAKLMVCNEYV